MAGRLKGRGTTKPAEQDHKQDHDKRGMLGNAEAALRSVLRSRNAPAAAKATAARTLAEMEGRIGRHQQAPVDRLADQRVSLLTRTELERELARLRTVCGTGDSG